MNKPSVLFLLSAVIHSATGLSSRHAADDLVSDAKRALRKGIEFYHSIALSGGYASRYSPDLKQIGQRDLIARASPDIYIDNDQTSLVGSAYLRAYAVTGEESYLRYAGEVANVLVKAQKAVGGWGRTFHLDNRPTEAYCDLWYAPTRNALLFLMAYDNVFRDERIHRV